MLALRLARGARPLVQLSRLLVSVASAGTGFLLLCALGYAMGHPEAPTESAARLAWCMVPLAATVYFAVSVARSDPGARPRTGLSAIGLGPVRLMMLAVTSTTLACTLGSLLALLFFLHLRGDLTGMPFDGAAAELLAAHQPLPVPAVITLLALVPLTASITAVFVLRPGARKATETPEPIGPRTPLPAPGGLSWGVALLAVGLAAEMYAGPRTGAAGLPGAGGLGGSSTGAIVGWCLTALGLALSGPGLTHLCGRMLQAVRPGALRMLAGRVLQTEAQRIGRPLGLVCAVASGLYAAGRLYGGDQLEIGPLTLLGALVVAVCAVAALLTAAVESGQFHADTTAALTQMGAPEKMLRGAASLRAGTLFVVFGPLTWAVAELSAVPLMS
ncbi:hypothetical protein H1V43_27015 [Streptomyces sp. PSKA54]|uniref:Uncharacterized protein n=1 Tax=Streptomyces himalayensis subsp. aureolus TaxID=2758039 RepID=A0A7W2D540_9ACTN|nr:hypothetical protein [Streptomyces himalayensis]MBA4864936.1 hypothetical protein [Streptomyces himalayensis subsp. aureolus]